MRQFGLAAVLVVVALIGRGVAGEPADTRTYWAYEGGWFAKAKDGTWYELNEPTFRKLGKPSPFKEMRRTKEFVELYDEGRKVAVRLLADSSEVRLSDDPAAPWEALYKGRWKTLAPAE